MDSATSSYTDNRAPNEQITSAKILIAGGFGVGKTTLVGAISEITPLTTEAIMTTASHTVDDTAAVPSKDATTVAMDFGRITISTDLVLYLFGTPGQTRFWFMWDELSHGAIGAVILADTRRIADSFGAIDFFEARRTPYLVAVNQFDGTHSYHHEELRDALALTADTPLLTCDARQRHSVRDTLVTLVQHAMHRHRTPSPSTGTRTPGKDST